MRLMKKLPKSFLLCATSLFTATLSASTIEDSDDIDQKDINAVREWINTKRQVTVRELGGALSISGEVRTEFQSTAEVLNGVKQRGNGAPGLMDDGDPFPTNSFDIEVNIMMDYRTDNSWGSVKLEFDNDAGIFSGTFDKLKLERAYWGVRVLDGDTYNFDTEAGRRRMSAMADSKLEFNSFFDGLWFKYDQSYDPFGDLYVHAGVFII